MAELAAEQILDSIGWPTQYVVLDFETYFDKEYSLSKIQPWPYITDPRFEFTGLAAYQPGKSPMFFAPDDIARRLQKLHDNTNRFEDVVVVMQNAQFDATILAAKFGYYPRFIVDTKHLAAHLDARGSKKLKDLAPSFGLVAKGDTTQFSGQHWASMSQDERTALIEYAENDVTLEAQLFELLLPKLTCPEMELPIACHTIGLYTRPKIKFNFWLAARLQYKMRSKFDSIIADTGHTLEEISGDKSFVAILQDALPEGESVPMKQGKKKMIPALAKTDIEMQELLKHPDPAVKSLMEAREACGSWPNHIKRVQKMSVLAKAAGGFLPIPKNYYGAHTGRFSGGGGINPDNLGGRGRAGHGNDPLIGRVRNLLMAPDGHKLVITDSAQIEARVLAWLAGETKLVDGFARGEDVYSEFATELFQAQVRKPKADDPPELYRVLSIRRGFGKDGILGSGFGMGGDKFHDRCNENPDLKPLFDSGEYDLAFSHGVIKTYRSTYPRVPAFWKSLEKMFTLVTRFPAEVWRWSAKDALQPGPGDLLTLWNDGGTVNIQLPSGRCLKYKHAAWTKGGLRYHYGPLWGGTLTENVVQAIARDLLVWWILRCEGGGISVVHHVHDENISIARDNLAEETLRKMMAIMRRVPGWAAGCPVDAEGQICDAYTK